MKKKYLFFYGVLVFLLMGIIPLMGQKSIVSTSGKKATSSKGKIKWMANAFDHQVFIENGGQFASLPKGDKILYGAQMGDVYVFITPHGLIYKYTQYPKGEKHGGEAIDPDDIGSKKNKPIEHYLTATWEGSTNSMSITPGEKQTYYYTYPGADDKSTIKVNVFKSVTCLNVYPGIDVKYTFPEGKDGFEYALIVHPGADISQIKLKYGGAPNMFIDKDGNVQINNGWGTFTDHAPKSYCDGQSDTITSSYQLQDNTESFHVTKPDVGKTLIIDPWSTNWSTAYSGNGGHNGAYDVDYDNSGNVYIFGSENPYQLAKYNSAGIQQWTFNASTFGIYYGDFCVDKTTGASFCFEGFNGSGGNVDKITTSGVLVSTLKLGTLIEQWRAYYDVCSNIIVIAGGGTANSYQAATLDTDNVTYTVQNVLGVPPRSPGHDMYFIGSDPIVDTAYMAPARTAANPRLDNNVLLRVPVPALSPTGLLTYDGFNFQELSSVSYALANGMNGMAISPNWAYLYDGDTLRQEDKNTGAINMSVSLSKTYFAWGGLDVDLCDNIYAGHSDSVDILNSSLTYQGTIGAFKGAVYDVVLNTMADSTMYVCGNGFVASVQIDPPDPPTMSKKRTHACSCNSTATGTLMLCGAPDTASNVSYAWSNGQTTHTAIGLCPNNTYTLTLSLGCFQQFTDTFFIPFAVLDTLSIVTTQTDPICGLCDGKASVVSSGGRSPFTYSWAPGGQTTKTATGLCVGNYTVSVTDSCGNISTAIVKLTTVGMTPTAKVISNDKCNGSCTGSASVSIIGGVLPYTYSWKPSGGTTSTATGLCAGTYTITVKDVNGCSNTSTVTITQPPPLTTADTVTHVLCMGGTGSIKALPSGGYSPYTYLWTPSGKTTVTVTGLSAGSYTLKVTDSSGCTASAMAVITQPTQLTAATIPTNALCFGGTGSAAAKGAGGTSPYAYLWNPSVQTNATATGLTVGAYTVSITDHNGCTATSTVTITQPTVITVTSAITKKIPCFGSTGSLTATAKGGTAPYTYSWTPSNQTNAVATGLIQGIYTITVTDNNHCTTTATTTITQPTLLAAAINNVTNVGCYNGSNGAATAVGSGGTTPYTYLWNPGGNTNAHATGLFALSYTATVTDNNGCSASASVNLTEPAQIAVTISEPKIICKDSTGILIANVTGGTAPYKYAWSSGGTSGTASVTPVSTNDYSVVVTDVNGCTGSANIVLQYGPPFTVAVSGKNSVCIGDSTIICANAIGATDGATFLWQPANSTNGCITVIPGVTSVYTVTVVDGCGATTTASTTVYTDPTPQINFYANLYQGCAPFCIQFHNSTTLTSGGIGQSIWNFGNGDTSHARNPIYCYPASGNYDISLTVISDSGCSATLKKLNLITIFSHPKAAFTYSPQPVTILTPTVQFTDESTDAYGIAYRWWSYGDNSDSSSNLADPVHTYQDTGSYCVNLIVMNNRGCTDTTTNCFIIEPDYALYIPSAFTPNGDGKNEVFKPVGKYIKEYEMYIFDRWGSEVFHSTDMNNGWNGTVKGTGPICQEDIYVYKITITDSKGTDHTYVGRVTLLK